LAGGAIMSREQKAVRATSLPHIPKYRPENLIEMFRMAAALRKQMLDAGFTDNGGAIHSAERILGLLGLRLRYPSLGHINNLRKFSQAEFSKEAKAAYEAGEKVLIEHVSPHRALTRRAIEEIEHGATPAEFKAFVKEHFRLVLLTPAEALRLNKLNRSNMVPDRLEKAGIILAALSAA
jgi:hypothetical protein